MIAALKCSSLSHAIRCVVEKNKNVIHQPKSVLLLLASFSLKDYGIVYWGFDEEQNFE